MTNEVAKPSRKSDVDSVLNGIRGLLFLLVLVSSIGAAFFSTKASIEEELRSIRENHIADQKSNTVEHNGFKQDLQRLDQRISEHTARGINGVAHPEGVIVALEQLKRDTDAKTVDRWSKHDHQMWVIEVYLKTITNIEKRLDKLEKQ